MVVGPTMQNTYTALYAHLVFATKNRERSLRGDVRSRLHTYLAGIARNLGSTPIAVGGVDDHVHLLIRYPSRIAISDLVMKLKSNSSRWIHDTFPKMRRFEWQDGYAALSVSQSRVAEVRRYIERQEDHHARRPFVDEWDEILRQVEGPSESVAADAAPTTVEP
jgi:REP element-mobilizing transposase RayT